MNPVLARRVRPVPLLLIVAAVSSVRAVAMGFAPDAVVLGALLAFGGFTTTLWDVVTVSMRQQEVPAELFGRVNSVYRMLGWGTRPLGALGRRVHRQRGRAAGAVHRRGHRAAARSCWRCCPRCSPRPDRESDGQAFRERPTITIVKRWWNRG